MSIDGVAGTVDRLKVRRQQGVEPHVRLADAGTEPLEPEPERNSARMGRPPGAKHAVENVATIDWFVPSANLGARFFSIPESRYGVRFSKRVRVEMGGDATAFHVDVGTHPDVPNVLLCRPCASERPSAIALRASVGDFGGKWLADLLIGKGWEPGRYQVEKRGAFWVVDRTKKLPGPA